MLNSGNDEDGRFVSSDMTDAAQKVEFDAMIREQRRPRLPAEHWEEYEEVNNLANRIGMSRMLAYLTTTAEEVYAVTASSLARGDEAIDARDVVSAAIAVLMLQNASIATESMSYAGEVAKDSMTEANATGWLPGIFRCDPHKLRQTIRSLNIAEVASMLQGIHEEEDAKARMTEEGGPHGG